MGRVYNFSAGPSCLPLPVLEKAGEEITNYRGSGMSVMEMSHRQNAEFVEIIADAERLLRELMNIPQNYKVLFLQGGATLQFSAIPMNLLTNDTDKADYVVSGQFSKKAQEEACKYGDIKVAATSKDRNFAYVPDVSTANVRPDAKYIHICYNNTIYGTKFIKTPDVGYIPLVADMSSCILSEPLDVSKYGLIYAGAQKNMGPSGLTVVIVREDLLGKSKPATPVIMDYKAQAEESSMYNTPPCYSIYIAKLVFEWIKNDIGGLEQMAKINAEKAAILYNYLDNSAMFKSTVDKEYRSMMNVPFVTGSEDLDKKFCKESEKSGFVNLKGHRAVGGMRASIYNAMPAQGISDLVEFMKKFEIENK